MTISSLTTDLDAGQRSNRKSHFNKTDNRPMDLREIQRLHEQYAQQSVVIELPAGASPQLALPAPGLGPSSAQQRFAALNPRVRTLAFITVFLVAAGLFGMGTASLARRVASGPSVVASESSQGATAGARSNDSKVKGGTMPQAAAYPAASEVVAPAMKAEDLTREQEPATPVSPPQAQPASASAVVAPLAGSAKSTSSAPHAAPAPQPSQPKATTVTPARAPVNGTAGQPARSGEIKLF